MAAPAPAASPVTYQYPQKVVELRESADRVSQKVAELKSRPSSMPGQIAADASSIASAIENACAARSLNVLEPFAAVAVEEIGRLLDFCAEALDMERGLSARLKTLTLRPKSTSRSSSLSGTEATSSLHNYRNSLRAVTVLLRIEGGQSQLVLSGMVVASPETQVPALLRERIKKLSIVNEVIKTALLAASNMTNSVRFPVKNLIQTVLQFYEHFESPLSNRASITALLSKVNDFVRILAQPGGQNIVPGEEMARAVEEFFRAIQSIIVRLEILKATEMIAKCAAPAAVQAVIDAADASLNKALLLLHMSLQVDIHNTVHQIRDAQRNTTSEVKFSSALPARPKILHGRDEQLHSLVHFVVDRSRPIRLAIMGAGGLGKTTLARALVQDPNVVATFGDHRFFVSAEAIAVVDVLVTGMLTTFGLPATSDALASLLRHLRSQDQTLLVIDNLETIWNSKNSEQRNATERVLSQLDEVASLTLIITCRGTDLPPNITWANRDATTLSTLSPEAALATFTDIARDVPAADKAIRDALLDAIDYMPLAVTLLARLVTRGHKMQQLYSRWNLKSVRTRMLRTHSNGRLDNVDASIQLSLDYLPMDDPEPLRLLSLSAQLPDGMRVPIREQLEGLCGFRDIDGALDILQGLALVYVTADGTVRMLSPIRLYVVQNHALPAALRTSLLEIYCDLGVQAPADVTAYSGAVRDKILPELRNLESVLLSEIQDFGVTPSRALIEAIVTITDFSRLNVPNDRLVVALIPRIAHLPLDLGLSLMILSQIQDFRGNIQASIELALKARCSFESAGDLLKIARCDLVLGDLFCRLHNYIEADARLSRARTLSLDLGRNMHAAAVIAALCELELAHVAYYQERYDEATAHCTSAREEFIRLDAQAYVAQCQQLRGNIYYAQAEYPAAARELESGLQLSKSLNVSTDIARSSVSLAKVYIAQERLDDALGASDEAYEIFREQGDALGSGDVLMQRAAVQWRRGNATETGRLVLDAQSMYESVGFLQGVKECADELSEYARRMGARGTSAAGTMLVTADHM